MGSPARVSQTARVRPPARLASSVTRCVGYRYEGFPPGTHLGLPSRHLTVVLSLDAPTRTIGPSATDRCAFAALAGGLHTRPVVIAHDGDLAGVQLDLTPEGARSLFGLPAAAIGSAVLSLDDLIGTRAGELLERLAEAPTWRARFAVVDDVLSRGIGRLPGPAPEIAYAWRRLAETDGTMRVGDLAREVGWSRRHLSERFAAEYGLRPKEAARVMRFERSKRLLQEPGRPSLANVAAACGYYDQAHLAREWNDLAGCPPSAWLADEELPFVQDDEDAAGER
ncbi:helix-turn-helix domain-containing protein [Actinoallomurus purpureus]|uniref:helix-turn-helix domain-containing protein n=1 Tax=Actinoallomurus purpureus TaxID=478114 RepID=UPI0020932CBC|nr:helix-turn-helix domain-containing protein [Actinoallomurus purpureus]MCO6010314.1 helix-turn-helix domain-containing protein [Actinoallomurus purpureus]